MCMAKEFREQFLSQVKLLMSIHLRESVRLRQSHTERSDLQTIF